MSATATSNIGKSKKLLFSLLLLIFILLILPVIALLIVAPRSVDIHPPLQTDYLLNMKTVESAKTDITHLDGGRVQISIDHEIIQGVSPEMIVWWFNTFPERKISINNQEVPWYWLWHPVDHIAVKVIKQGTIKADGSSTPPQLEIHEQYGPNRYIIARGSAAKVDTSGVRTIFNIGPVDSGSLEHIFTPVPGGTRCETRMILGLDIPVVGNYFNFLMQQIAVDESTMRAWIKHNVEEMGNFQFFLPKLYADYAG